MNNNIDIVVTWVDGSDPIWQEKRKPYLKKGDILNDAIAGEKRYKDTGFFKYFFRGIEKFAPWVNKVYLVTDNQYPSWLNLNHEKLVLIDHKDIIDNIYLPTFKSTSITLNLHKIAGLSENFVFFNDDMFLIGPTKETDFFVNNLPCDMAVLGLLSPSNDDMFWNIRSNLISIINSKYDTTFIKKHIFKWLNYKYPLKYNLRNLFLLRYKYITDFLNPHIPHSYSKSYFNKVWDYFASDCNLTMQSKFRSKRDVFEWLVRYCQLLEGHFHPTNIYKKGHVYDANDKGIDDIIKSNKFKYVCINNDADEVKKQIIIESFNYILPEKSTYEK